MCLKEFWTRERVLNHIKYRSKVCRLNLHLRGPCLSEQEADALDFACASSNVDLYRQGRRRHHVSKPSIRLPGPLLAVVLPEDLLSEHHPLGVGRNYS